MANPLDYTALIWGEVGTLRELVRTVGADPAIERVLIFYDRPPGIASHAAASWEAVEKGIVAGAAVSPAPVMVAATLPELLDDEAAWRFCEAGVPAVGGLRTGVAVAAALAAPPADPARLLEIAAAARRAPRRAGRWLAEHEAKALLRARGVPVVAGRLALSEDDAVAAFREVASPVALKLSGPGVRHKTAIGALALDVRDEAGVREAYRRLAGAAESRISRQANPSATAGVANTRIACTDNPTAATGVDYGRIAEVEVLVETMAPRGVEVFIAVRTNAVVPVLAIGPGGIHVETLDAVAIVPLPADTARISRALASLNLPPHAARIAAQIAAAAHDLQLLECNPVLIHPEGAVVVDAVAKEVAT